MVATAEASTPTSVDTTGWLTADQAVDLLGVSRASLYQWERRGILHSERAQRGKSVRLLIVYDPRELMKMPRRHRTPPPNEAGELAARVFEMLEDGKNLREILIETRETPAKIDELHQAWCDAGGSELILGRAARAEIEPIIGAFSTVSELVQKIIAIAKPAEQA